MSSDALGGVIPMPLVALVLPWLPTLIAVALFLASELLAANPKIAANSVYQIVRPFLAELGGAALRAVLAALRRKLP